MTAVVLGELNGASVRVLRVTVEGEGNKSSGCTPRAKVVLAGAELYSNHARHFRVFTFRRIVRRRSLTSVIR